MPGPYYFAYVDADEMTFTDDHLRFDEDIMAYDFEHNEGEAATLSITALNPRVGLLAPSRKQHCFMAYVDPETDTRYVFFRGRIEGVPEELTAELIRVRFSAKPQDAYEQKLILAAANRSLPTQDPVFVSPDRIRDPDAILDAMSALFYSDPVTHEMSISDMLSGEDGTVEFSPDDLTYDDLEIRPTGVAAAKVVGVQAKVNWTQRAAGTVDITASITAAFQTQPTAGVWIAGTMATFTPDGLISNFPVPGDNVGGGWSVADANIVYVPARNSPFYRAHARVSQDDPQQTTAVGGILPLAVNEFSGFTVNGGQLQYTELRLTSMIPTLVLKYDVSRSYEEILSFVMRANVQDVKTDAPTDEEMILIDLSSNDVGEPVDTGESADEFPIGDLRRRSYFLQDRGRRSLEYLLLLARATLRIKSRVVNGNFSPINFVDVFQLSLRKNALLEAPTLNGGQALGKITSIRINCDGSTGTQRAFATMGCAVGKGGIEQIYPVSSGYVESGYVEHGYVSDGNSLRDFIEGEIYYEDFSNTELQDDGINFFNMSYRDVVNSIVITNGYAQQRLAFAAHGGTINGFFNDIEEAQRFLKNLTTTVCIDLKPLEGGPFSTSFEVLVSELGIPKMYDLEAESNE